MQYLVDNRPILPYIYIYRKRVYVGCRDGLNSNIKLSIQNLNISAMLQSNDQTLNTCTEEMFYILNSAIMFGPGDKHSLRLHKKVGYNVLGLNSKLIGPIRFNVPLLYNHF